MNDLDVPEKVITLEDIFYYLEILVKRRKLMLIAFFSITLPVLIYLLIAPPIFVASTSILPQKARSTSPLDAIVSSARYMGGFDIGLASNNSTLYEAILTSDRLIGRVLMRKFNSDELKATIPLIELLGGEGENAEELLYRGRELLRSMMEVTIEKRSKITTLEVAAKNPQLAADIAKSFIRELDIFLREISREKARENTTFIKERLQETITLLKNAENDLKLFRETNKRIENSPELQLILGSFVREVKVQEEVFLVLKKELEVSKVEEVKMSSVVTILNEASPPAFKSRPKRRIIMTITIILAMLISPSIALGIEIWNEKVTRAGHTQRVKNTLLPVQEDWKFLKSSMLGKSE